jgi:hypothetical protein
MNQKQIENIQKVGSEIQNFRDCYQGVELWGQRDGPVSVESLISFLIEHPEFQQIADQIAKLNKVK